MTELAELIARATELASAGQRRLLGITGPPGAGKSLLAERIVAGLAGRAALVGMDGFHLADAELVRIGLADRKGAPETFDRDGFVALLARLRANAGTIYAPVFDRRLEDSRAAAVAVPADVPLVVIEGNYLLHWPEVRPLLDEVWYLDPDPEQRRAALTARHVAYGRSPEQAQLWVARSDERNADLVAAGRNLADRRIRWSRQPAGRRLGWSSEPDRDDSPGRQPHRTGPER
jgi:pantothenate kinase